MRVLVCGGRGYKRKEAVFQQLNRVHSRCAITTIIEGGATGADSFGKEWGLLHRVDVEHYPIEQGEGGFARNRRMLRVSRPELVVFFPGGNGTKHMVEIARLAGVATLGGLDRDGVNSFTITFNREGDL